MTFGAAVAIEDPADPRLAPYGAVRERDLTGRQGRFIVEGEVTLRAMLSTRARFPLESVLILPERLPALSGALAARYAALPDPPPVYVAGRAVMQAVAGFPIHRGVLAVGLRGPERAPDALIPPAPVRATVLALVGLTNHDNVGGCFRNAAAFGADAVLLDETTCDPLYRKAIRVSAGAALTVPFARAHGAETLLALARRHALVPLAMTPGAEAEIAQTALPARALVLLGTEGPGLPESLMAAACRVRIGMAQGFDSLNVAVAGAIVLHYLRVAADRAVRPAEAARDNPLQLPRS